MYMSVENIEKYCRSSLIHSRLVTTCMSVAVQPVRV